MEPILTSLLSGAAVVVIWEGLVKPARIKRQTARVIAEELAIINGTCVDLYIEFVGTPYFAPHPDTKIPTRAFDAVALHIGGLDQVADVVYTYVQVDEVVMAARLWAFGDEKYLPELRHDSGISANRRQELEVARKEQRRNFLRQVAIVLDLTWSLVPSLRETARVYDCFEIPKGLREVVTSGEAMRRAVEKEREDAAELAAAQAHGPATVDAAKTDETSLTDAEKRIFSAY
jgi:hypothetical protein